MKTIGLIGGMSWQSTADYYREINQGISDALGGLHSAEIVLRSVDFEPIERLQQGDDWRAAAAILATAAQGLEAAGASFFLICTNTMHKVADSVQEAVSIPLLHIADATAQELVRARIKTVGLLGTAFTMEQSFYKGRLEQDYGLEVLTPTRDQRGLVHDVIYQELCLGKISAASKASYLDIIDSLAGRGAQAVILGCTEIGLLIQQADTPVPLFDTTRIHARAAVHYALSES